MIWLLAKIDKLGIKLYRGYEYDDTSRDWAKGEGV
jgi:hypothetical protein